MSGKNIVTNLAEAVREESESHIPNDPLETYKETLRHLFMKDKGKFCRRFLKGFQAIKKEMKNGHGEDGGIPNSP
jgi:hypothetical protein